MKKKYLISTFLALSVSAACLSGCEPKILKEAEAEEKVHISFSFWEPSVDNNLQNGLEKVIENYGKIHPEVEVELISKPVSGYQDWIKEQYAANRAPTIESNHTPNLATRYEQGLVYDFKDELKKINEYDGVVWKDEFSERKLEQADNGITLPWFDLGVAYYYNKNVYKELNLTVPETWNEFMSNCRAIEDYGKTPIALMAQKKDALVWLKLYIEGGMISRYVNKEEYDADQDGSVSTDDVYKAIVSGKFDVTKGEPKKMLSELLDCYKLYGRYAHNAIELDETEAKQKFLTGEAVHIMTGSWDMKGFEENKSENVDIGVFKLPKFTAENTEYPGNTPFLGGVQSLAITASATEEQKTAAMDFLKFLFSKEQYKVFYETTMQMPTMKGFDNEQMYEPFRAQGGNSRAGMIVDSEDTKISCEIFSGMEISADEFAEEIQKSNEVIAKKYIKSE